MKILMISNHLGVQSGVQRYVQNLLLNLTLPATRWICLSAFARQIKLRARRRWKQPGAYHCGAGQ